MKNFFTIRWGIPLLFLLGASLMSWFNIAQLNSTSHEDQLSYELLLAHAQMDKALQLLEGAVAIQDIKAIDDILTQIKSNAIIKNAQLLPDDFQGHELSQFNFAKGNIVATVVYHPNQNKLMMVHPMGGNSSKALNVLFIDFNSLLLQESAKEHALSLKIQGTAAEFTFAILFTLLVYILIVRRLEKLRSAVELFGKGRRYSEILIRGGDEIAELAQSIKVMHSERSKFVAELEDSKNQLNKAQFITHIGSWDWNIIENTLFWSDEIYRIFGLKPQEFEANYEAFLERVHLEDRDKVNSAVSLALEGKAEYWVEHRVVQLSGEVREVLEQGFISRDEDGKPVRMLGTVLDTTERKIIERELQRSKDELEIRVEERTAEANKLLRAVEGSPNVVMITNKNGELEYANQRFEEVFGYEVSKVLGKKPSILRADNLTAKDFQNLWATITSGQVWRGEFHNRTKAGARVWQAASIAPVKNQNGEITNYIATQENIDQLKLIEEQLLEAIKQAELASSSKGLFLANMSHEIRTPMNAIIGMTDLVLETELSKYQKKHLNSVASSAKSLLFLLNEILDLSKLEAGKLLLEKTTFDLVEIIELVFDTLKFDAERKNLLLKIVVNPDVPVCFEGDPTRLRQVLINIAGNAVKFTQSGSVTIEVDTTKDEEVFHLKVIDTGIGIAPENINKIFESFSQADDTTTRKFGGTGLGTTISRRIIDVMGGTIYVESEVGKGSTFHIIIPLKTMPGSSCRVDALQNKKRSLKVSPLKVLIAEDQVLNQELASSRLIQHHHQVVIAADGVEALQAIQKEQFDLVLMDIQMPNMDGLEATKEIRKLEQGTRKHLMIIALTASAMVEEKQKCWDAGVDGFVTKPIDFPNLFSEIARLFPDKTEDVEVVEEVSETLMSLEGLDTKRGVEVWGSVKAYRKAIISFVSEFKDADKKLIQLLESKDYDKCSQFIHAIKGVSGNISAFKLFEVSNLIEELIRSGEKVSPVLVEEFQAQVQILMQSGSVLNAEKMQVVETNEFDANKVTELLKIVKESLSHGAIDEPSFEELETYLEAELSQQIQHWVDEFDFEKATVAVDEVAKLLNLDLG